MRREAWTTVGWIFTLGGGMLLGRFSAGATPLLMGLAVVIIVIGAEATLMGIPKE